MIMLSITISSGYNSFVLNANICLFSYQNDFNF